MTRTMMNKLVAMFLAVMMTIALGMYVPQIKADAATSADFSISDNGISFICAREGFHSTCYSDYSQSSIGYGTKCTASSVQPHASGSHTITKEDAMNALKTQVNSTYAPRVRTQTKGITMNQNQFDALVSLCYNCGGGNTMISNSPLVKYLKGELSESQARSNYSNYIVTAGGKKLPGLVNRRNAEADLFFSGCDDELGISYPRPSGNPLLSMGSRGSGVSWLQAALNKANNAGLDVDGQFGSGTKQAVINFQKANGLEADGIAGPATVNKLVEVIKGGKKEIVTPTITSDKPSYIAGDTVNISWTSSPEGANLSHYWLNVIAPDGTYVYGGTMNKGTSYSFVALQTGNYNITAYATPIGSKEGEGSLTDNKIITVSEANWYAGLTPVDVGTDFYAYIINVKPWLHLKNVNGNVEMAKPISEKEQLWKFKRNSDGSYRIISCTDGGSLDVYCAYSQSGTNVQTHAKNESSAQKWFIYGEDNNYIFKPDCSDCVLDVTGGSTSVGTNVEIWTKNDSSAQRFQIWKRMPELSVTAGDKTKKTTFGWTGYLGEDIEYQLRIWKGTLWEGDSYKDIWHINDAISYEVNLPAGHYEAYIDVCIGTEVQMTNVVKFDVTQDVHEWSEWETLKEATCKSEGQEERYCSICGAKETCSIAKKVHKFTVKVIAPTFTKQGYDLHTCSKCGDFYKDNYTAMKIKGDINADGEFNISDVLLLQKWILADPNAKLADWKAADLYEDGKLDVYDLCIMKKLLVENS